MQRLILKMKKMKIKNHQELLHKKRILKEAILIQEDQLKDNIFTNTFSRFKNYSSNRTLLGLNADSDKINPRIEQGVNLALATLSSQLLKGKKIGTVSKVAIGIGVLVAGKLIAGKLNQYTSKKSIE